MTPENLSRWIASPQTQNKFILFKATVFWSGFLCYINVVIDKWERSKKFRFLYFSGNNYLCSFFHFWKVYMYLWIHELPIPLPQINLCKLCCIFLCAGSFNLHIHIVLRLYLSLFCLFTITFFKCICVILCTYRLLTLFYRIPQCALVMLCLATVLETEVTLFSIFPLPQKNIVTKISICICGRNFDNIYKCIYVFIYLHVCT